jgi:hypothetical protein
MSTIRIGVVKGVPPNNTAGLSLTTGVAQPKNGQTPFKARFVQVQAGPAVYLVQLIPQSGEDASPPNGSIVAILESAGIRLGVAVQDNVPPSVALNQGEKRVYGSDGSGNLLGLIKFKANGKLYIGNANLDANPSKNPQYAPLGTSLANLMSALSSLLSDLTTLASALASATTIANVAAAGAALQLNLPSVTQTITSAQNAIAALLDTSQ